MLVQLLKGFLYRRGMVPPHMCQWVTQEPKAEKNCWRNFSKTNQTAEISNLIIKEGNASLLQPDSVVIILQFMSMEHINDKGYKVREKLM